MRVVVALLLLGAGIAALRWSPPAWLATREQIVLVLGPAIPGGLVLLLVAALLALTGHWGSAWTRTLRATGTVVLCSVAWWILGWLLVTWITMAVDGWLAFGFWPTAVA